nr:MerR family transcriptional regulator [uncultured Tolumonas sp.]
MFTIKEFESITNISAHNLRYFDKIGLLSPQRGNNGYRMYSHSQIEIAHMIVVLQKAKVPNSEIKIIFNNYTSKETISVLMESKNNLLSYIAELTSAYELLSSHVCDLEKIASIKNMLDKPFIEDRDDFIVGKFTLDTDNILDFFEVPASFSNSHSWYLMHNYGFILNKCEVRKDSYPLVSMYCDEPMTIKKFPYAIQSGRYMSAYCRGSLERNVNVYQLMHTAKECGYKLLDNILIENVSGPAIESKKSDYIIKIMVPVVCN